VLFGKLQGQAGNVHLGSMVHDEPTFREKKNTRLAYLPKTQLLINVEGRRCTFAGGVFHHVHLSTGVHMLGKRTLDKRCR
jgi:hypothetical protein